MTDTYHNQKDLKPIIIMIIIDQDILQSMIL